MKFMEWTAFHPRPLCQVISSIGEAGNIDAESMRLLKMHDICTESYENEEQELTTATHESLKAFISDIDPVTKEWIIP